MDLVEVCKWTAASVVVGFGIFFVVGAIAVAISTTIEDFRRWKSGDVAENNEAW